MNGWWDWVRRRLDVLLRKRSVEDELDDEIRFHLEMEIREHVRAGVDPAEARRRALVAFGGVERFKEEVRDVRGARVLDDLRQDLSLALRALPRQPAFTVAVLLTLGIGIGGNVAMFAVLRASVFSVLPYEAPDRLLVGRSTFNDGERLGPMVSGPDYLDYRDQVASLDGLGAIVPGPQRATLQTGDGSERLDVVWTSTDLFDVLGVAPVAGRGFQPSEGEPGAPAVALLSHGYWQRRFGGDPAVVGSTLLLQGGSLLSGEPATVVGVMPPNARFMVDADVWVPIVRGEGWARSRSAHNLTLVARLARGAARNAAQAEADAVSVRLAEVHPDSNRGKGLLLTPLRETLVERYRTTLALLVGAVVLLLGVACANVAGLLLARANARRSELAVRAVIGASGGRLTRQLMTESALLAVGAGVLGVAFAIWIERGVLAFVSMDRLGPLETGLSAASVLFALALSMGTVVLFGALPSIRAARRPLADDLRGGAGRVVGGRRATRLRSSLVVAQVASTVVLLAVSGLLLRSLQELRAVDPGFDAEGLLTAEVELPGSDYGQEARIAFFEALRDRVTALPGVTGVTLASQLPVRDPGNNWGIGAAGGGAGPESARLLAHQRTVMPGYFREMGIPLLLGRDVEASDRGGSPPAIILGRATAERLFGEESPLGRTVSIDGNPEPRLHEVVGVVEDVVLDGPAAGAPPAMYYPFHWSPPGRMRLAIRHRGEDEGLASGLREALRALDPRVPLDGVESMDAVLARYSGDQRALAVLIGAFAIVAVLLAAVGLYGVLAYQVSRRVRELGIRMALGASASSVTAGVLRGGLLMVAGGLLLGIPAALAVARLVRNALFGVGNADPLTFLAVSALLVVIGTVACVVPAARAARVDPTEAFRSE